MQIDQLITYGFQRVIEELIALQEDPEKEERRQKEEDKRHKEIMVNLAEISYKLGLIQAHVISIDNCILECTGILQRLEQTAGEMKADVSRIQSNTFLIGTRKDWGNNGGN